MRGRLHQPRLVATSLLAQERAVEGGGGEEQGRLDTLTLRVGAQILPLTVQSFFVCEVLVVKYTQLLFSLQTIGPCFLIVSSLLTARLEALP